MVNYSLRYRKGLDLVLKGINCHIEGGEKVCLYVISLQWFTTAKNDSIQVRFS